MNEQPDNRVRFQVKMPPALHRQAKILAATRGKTVNDLIVTALKEYVGDPAGDPGYDTGSLAKEDARNAWQHAPAPQEDER